MASLADLPQELVDHIVSELGDDLPSLSTCALISPAFLHWSRQRLFRSVRVTASNLYAFGKLIESSPSLASHIHLLNIPKMDFSAVLPVSLLPRLPNLTRIVTHRDPFDFRHLSPAETTILAGAVARLTSVTVLIDRLWTLPAWAALLNACPALTHLAVHAEANGWGTWTADDVALPMPLPSTDPVLRLHSLRVSGDCKILSPLGAWLLPQHALAALYTLVLDVDYVLEDYSAPDARLPLVRAAASFLRELTLSLDPPMPLLPPSPPSDVPPLCLATSFPHLRALHLTDGPDAEIGPSLVWLAAFLAPPSLAPTAAGLQRGYAEVEVGDGPLERLALDHSMTRRDLLGVPAATWRALEDALLGVGACGDFDCAAGAGAGAGRGACGDAADAQILKPRTPTPTPTPTHTPTYTPTPYPHLRTLTFTGYVRTARCASDGFELFATALGERVPRLAGKGKGGRGVLVVRR
ncbi:hypothetical protein B0H16DRAFT_1885194 [Mycena metata]|uniref:F-box domain-containing protein n=1 Tax=Mycena metata TaxID=1033252 RepID=A0AAD7JAK3_9AGAR|nr:hypothetical protein B0H16DRAFT_1885194 [Mycena metata]